MSEIKLFSIDNQIHERISSKVILEKELQNLIEANMEVFFGVRFLKSEYPIKDGRMDSIGIDENGSPVIFEYKRSQNENVINQGLFYLDWLLEHKGDFTLLVQEKLGLQEANEIDWSVPSVICIAHSFTKYDLHAVNQIPRAIKLVCYRKYDNDLVLFEYLNNPVTNNVEGVSTQEKDPTTYNDVNTHSKNLASATDLIKTLYQSICNYIESLGDDIAANQLKKYLAYKKVQNIVCIDIRKTQIHMFLKLSPDSVKLEKGFTRDVRGVGHYGTGDLQVTINNTADFEKAKPLLERAYNEN